MAKVNEVEGDEIWKPVVGYEGLYEVSSMGRIRAPLKQKKNPICGTVTLKPMVLKDHSPGDPYSRIKLCKNGTQHLESVHRIVAKAFLGESPGSHVNHKDLNKRNNRIENLEWVSPGGNIKHAQAHGLFIGRRKKSVVRIEDGVIFQSLADAARAVNANVPLIWHVIRGDRKHTRGFSFEYYKGA